ncbi:two-component response regulator ARR5-like [Bidens hawaiensis]|uniref:two-component response regulator ARR5-like n=1 Tax=Bidens hawaiensis TaxID=980011 RepID=UPI0040497E04
MSMEYCEKDMPHVLAVDDNIIDRKLVEKLLKTSSCRVTVVENAMRALEYLGLKENQQQSQFNGEGAKVNMIITDYSMPGMTGYELLHKIKESSMLKDVPVVIMSLENIPNRISECLEKRAEGFLLKPVKLAYVKKLRYKLAKF